MSTMLATAGRVLHRLLQRNGLDADDLYLECGLDPLKLDIPRARYPLERNRALWRLAHERIPDPCWGLAGGEVWRQTDFHVLGCAFVASRTLEAALVRLARYYRIVIQDLALLVTTDRDSLRISYAPPSADADIRPLQDTRWSVILRLCREAYGADLPLQEVQLTHGWEDCAYEQFFGCPVRYESDRSGLTFALDVVRRRLPTVHRELATANDRILDEFDRCLADTSMTGRVRRAVLDGLSSGKPTAKDVARGLALTARTLQRKLQEEGTTFQAVSDAVRKELAQQYIQSGEYDLNEVTYLTGFAHPSGFSRAYKAWTGRSPNEDRGRD
jgi:AraC-like DNA-binding protein